mmetsp:Transcript_64058/g.164825  ORF Transcript_64058/g.164825 Transcript_64058/m.164825 type:complete len:103 (-) Transcript_64058:150-458(-)
MARKCVRVALALLAAAAVWQLVGIAFLQPAQKATHPLLKQGVAAGLLAAAPPPVASVEQSYDGLAAPELVALFLPTVLIWRSSTSAAARSLSGQRRSPELEW